MTDKKIKDYLERAYKLVKLGKYDFPEQIIEVAKMIQLEEHRK